MKLVGALLASQGFGSGARVSTSGELKAARHFLGQNQDAPLVIFDVGANRGEYSTGILALYPHSKIFAFEPSQETYTLLKRKLPDNEQIEKLNYGLGAKRQTQLLYKESKYARIASLSPLDVIDKSFTETVEIRTLDQVVSELNIGVINLLKIDVEGHELAVMRGGEKTIASQYIEHIQFEIGGSSIDTNTTFKNVYEFLSDYSYTIYLINRRGLVEIEGYRYQYEQYSTTNFFAELRSK